MLVRRKRGPHDLGLAAALICSQPMQPVHVGVIELVCDSPESNRQKQPRPAAEASEAQARRAKKITPAML